MLSPCDGVGIGRILLLRSWSLVDDSVPGVELRGFLIDQKEGSFFSLEVNHLKVLNFGNGGLDNVVKLVLDMNCVHLLLKDNKSS